MFQASAVICEISLVFINELYYKSMSPTLKYTGIIYGWDVRWQNLLSSLWLNMIRSVNRKPIPQTTLCIGGCPFSTTEGTSNCHHSGTFPIHVFLIGQLFTSGSQGCAEIEFLSLFPWMYKLHQVWQKLFPAKTLVSITTGLTEACWTRHFPSVLPDSSVLLYSSGD